MEPWEKVVMRKSLTQARPTLRVSLDPTFSHHFHHPVRPYNDRIRQIPASQPRCDAPSGDLLPLGPRGRRR